MPGLSEEATESPYKIECLISWPDKQKVVICLLTLTCIFVEKSTMGVVHVMAQIGETPLFEGVFWLPTFVGFFVDGVLSYQL